ncbi:hypothetical protein J1N10_19575 [Carboxylicivirga sp. A043]|uniref:J domain-containing protein n=1 Tax=Carboxylicivirga linearis TaxID=1628157 RepID=A0ABS5K4A5_9BACT|nr:MULTISPECIES: hypothetical protein [Carboxylicivirga]MBS2101319.1 hypothetical protein [Carboxylicivirga linearis]MCU4158184.1 hypothetical protein [Carboxylicivirga sp. A043]
MKYFLGITDIEQAKLHYRKLAKQLHPDKGGTAIEFQKMQTEYKDLLINLQQKQKVVTSSVKTNSAENELINELGRLAKVLIKKQVPQHYLQEKMYKTKSTLKKTLISHVVDILNEL